TAQARHALSRDAQALSAVDAAWKRDQHLSLTLDASAAAAAIARFGDDLTAAAAARAGRAEHDEAALGGDLPRTAALGTRLRFGARLGAGALARLAGRGAAHVDLLLAAGHRLFQANAGLHPHVAAALRGRATTALCPEASEEIGEHVL